MKMSRTLVGFLVVVLPWLILQATPHAVAQDQDPPGRVVRLNYTNGSVSFQPGAEGDWVTAVVNRPVTTGDNLWADQNSRAELHIGSTAIRMDSETSLTFLDVDDQTTQLRLSMGTVMLRVRHIDDGDQFEVDTPNLAFTIQRAGEYRFDVNEDGNQTTVTIWSGRGVATGAGYDYTVLAGQQAIFNGTDSLSHEIAQLPPNDDFENWAFDRDRREDRAESANYISTEMTGYEDLDDQGRWHYAAGYGPVWTPIGLAPGWAPYRFGHWAWIDPWGWTWVDDEPWGFAPFHYGRWAVVDDSWCWVPGPVVIRPVYAPALVGFVGGTGFQLAVGGGPAVGWFPLGPREVYLPPYRVSRGYVNNINITNTRVNITQVTNVYNRYTTNNITNITYVNQHVNNGVTVVSRDTFVNARPVGRNLARVDARQLTQAPVTHTPPVQPVKASVLGAGAPARVRPPASVERRQVVGTRSPTPPKPPFEQRENVPNRRTQTSGQGTSASVTRREQRPQPQAQEPSARGNEDPERNQQAERRERPNNVPRPPGTSGAARGQGEARRYESPGPSQGAIMNRTETGAHHPLVRPAPPVESRPQVDESEQNKFHQWQQNRPNVPRPTENRQQGKQSEPRR
jgi:hypothetical protein